MNEIQKTNDGCTSVQDGPDGKPGRGQSTGRDIYQKIVKNRMPIIAFISIATVLLVLVNLTFFIKIASPAEAFHALFDPEGVSSGAKNIVWIYRVPETCFAVLVGLGLGMAGVEMQTILNNPLAEPYTLGISMSAAFGASLVIAFGFGYSLLGEYSMLVSAFVMAMVACAIIYAVAKRTSNKTTIILVGVALLFLFQAMVNGVQVMAGKDGANAITFWMFGSLSRYTDMEYIGLLALVVVVCAVLFFMNNWKMSALKLGDAKVSSMGIDVNKLRRNTIVVVSILAATCVSFTGTIGFVGLVGPHIARMLVGDDQRYLLPLSGLCGAFMLTLSAVIIKTMGEFVMPIGVVTAVIGVPFFLYLLLKRKGAMA